MWLWNTVPCCDSLGGGDVSGGNCLQHTVKLSPANQSVSCAQGAKTLSRTQPLRWQSTLLL